MKGETQKIVDFIGEQLARGDDETRLCKLVICHVVKGNKLGDEIRMVTVPEPKIIDEEWAQGVATKILEQAAAEAVSLGAGIQRYAVQAYFGADAKSVNDRATSRHVFVCQGAEDELGAIGTEGPDAEGLVSQAQRHSEFYARAFINGYISQIKTLQDELGQLRRENQQLRAERIENFRIMEEVYSAKHQRDAETRRAEVTSRVFESSAEKVEMLLPLAINHLAGKTIFPESVGNSLLLKSFVESITPDDLARLGGVLRPEQMATLVNLGMSVSRPKPDEPKAVAPVNGVSP